MLYCCSELCCLLRMISDFLSNPFVDIILGVFGGFVASLYILYLQFKRSTAWFRLINVINSTKEIVALAKSNQYSGYARNKARYSMGVPIDCIAQCYKETFQEKISDRYPNLTPIVGNRWEDFNLYVRPVIEDINPYSFLGWIPLSTKMKQLQNLVNFINLIENVVASLDVVIQIQENNNIVIVTTNNGPGFGIAMTGNTGFDTEINTLLQHYRELEKQWYNWLKLIH